MGVAALFNGGGLEAVLPKDVFEDASSAPVGPSAEES